MIKYVFLCFIDSFKQFEISSVWAILGANSLYLCQIPYTPCGKLQILETTPCIWDRNLVFRARLVLFSV